MKKMKGNIWDIKADAKCITTNGFLCKSGRLSKAVMGRGVAKQAAVTFSGLP